MAPDPVGDVQSGGAESPRVVTATDVTKVVYAVTGSAEAVKIRIVHGRTLAGPAGHHRAVTTFTHDGSDYRLSYTSDSASLFLLEGDTWTRLHPRGLSTDGSDGQLAVRFPISALGRAFVMDDLRTRLVVAGTSIVDRTSTDEELPVYPPR